MAKHRSPFLNNDVVHLIENNKIPEQKLWIAVLSKAKPSSSKGEFIKNVHMSSTMGPSISVDINI